MVTIYGIAKFRNLPKGEWLGWREVAASFRDAFWSLMLIVIIMVVNMRIGMITPPEGLNLFVTSGVAGMPMMRVVRAAAPFLLVLFIFLIMVTYIPALSKFLPTSLMGPEIITN